MDSTIKSYWVICPKCGGKTKTRIRQDTVLLNFPLHCPKCKKETLVNIVKLKTVIRSEEPDE